MTDKKKQVIKKIKLIVKDDFFDDIVNGLKTPIEEKIEKEDADSSKIDLGGQQLQRIKKSILPEIGTAIRNGDLIQTYVEETRNQYQKLKIQEIKHYIKFTEEGVKELEDVEEEAEDELEEIKSGGSTLFSKFLRSIKKLWGVVSFALRFYSYYSRVKGVFDKSKLKSNETMYSFNLNSYDLSKELEREKACRDFSRYLNSTILERIKDVLSPFMFHITKAVYAATDMVFAQVNRKIWIWIAKQAAYFLWEIALTLALNAIAAALTASGVGTAAGVALFAATAARIANLSRKILKFSKAARGIYKTLKAGGKITRALAKGARRLDQIRRSRVVRNAGAGAMRLIRRARRMPKSQRREIIDEFAGKAEKVARVDEAVDGAFMLGNLLTIDKADIQRFRNQIQSGCIKMGQGIYRGLDRVEQYIRNSNKRKEADSYKGRVLQSLSEKYSVNILGIEGLSLDFEHVGEAINKLGEGIKFPRIDIDRPGSIGNTLKLNGFTIDRKEGAVSFDMGNNRVFNFDENTHKRFKKLNKIDDGYVKLKKNGISLRYNMRTGSMEGVWLDFESNYRLPTIRQIKNRFGDSINIAFDVDDEDDQAFNQSEGKPNTLRLGVERIANSSTNYETKKITSSRDAEVVIIKDLSEITTPRNEQLKLEKDVLTKMKNLAKELNIKI